MKAKLGAVILGTILSQSPVHAAVLNFAGLNGTNGNYEHVLEYYNGGTGGLGSSGGINHGISFGSDAIVGGPTPETNSAQIPGGPGANLLFFLTGAGDMMNVAAGFKNGFSFDYSAPFYTGNVTVWSGLDGTGTLLQTLALSLTTNGSSTPGCLGTNYCPYTPVGVTFSGTARSVDFSGTANYIAFANVTLGSAIAGDDSVKDDVIPTPIPGAIWLFGSALMGMEAFRKRITNRKHA